MIILIGIITKEIINHYVHNEIQKERKEKLKGFYLFSNSEGKNTDL